LFLSLLDKSKKLGYKINRVLINFPNKKYIEKHRGYDDAVHEALIIFELYNRNKWKPIIEFDSNLV